MHLQTKTALLGIVGFSISALVASVELYATCPPQKGEPAICCSASGPDVVVGDIHNCLNYSPDPRETFDTGFDAFSFGTTSCNVGDENLIWNSSTNEHAVIGQNLFKLKDGQFEQIGLSWLKHGFFALSEEACGCSCTSTDGSELGVGCSDPYSAYLNGTQSNLGPRWQVNAHTGVFAFEPADPPFSGETARRLRIALTDLEPSSTEVLYFVEAHYITQDDADSGNANNNASYRAVSMSTFGPEFSAALIGSTQIEQAGIRAWQDSDSNVVETDIQIPSEGLFILAAKATDLGDGTWHYEYAVQNVNSDRSGSSFSVPVASGVNVTNIEFHDVQYHSSDGEPDGATPQDYDGTDWVTTNDGTSISWMTAHSYSESINANALRWGTLYNFRFDADQPPKTGDVTLGLFKPDTPDSVNASTIVPGVPCLADVAPEESGGDGDVDINDLRMVVLAWGESGGPADVDGNGTVDMNDLRVVILAWGSCP